MASFSSTVPQTPTLLPSQYLVHPIDDLLKTIDKAEKEEDHTEVTHASSFDEDDQDDRSMDLEMLTPYPAYTTTSKEIQEWKDLEVSLGENWSLRLAGGLSSCDMSVDGTIESDEGSVCSFECDDDKETIEIPSSFQLQEEDEEIRRKRNLLWKQSLKSSMFTKGAQ